MEELTDEGSEAVAGVIGFADCGVGDAAEREAGEALFDTVEARDLFGEILRTG